MEVAVAEAVAEEWKDGMMEGWKNGMMKSELGGGSKDVYFGFEMNGKVIFNCFLNFFR